jgi:hypothetical protein
MRIRLRVRGPGTDGGYDMFLDGQLVGTGFSAKQAAVYVRDAVSYGGKVLPEYLDGRGGVALIMPPDITRALDDMLATGQLDHFKEPEPPP